MNFAQIQEWTTRLEAADDVALNLDTPVLFGSPKTLTKEWRAFIVDGKVISASRYQLQGEPSLSAEDVPAGLVTFVEERCAEYQPHPIFVMDVALVDGNYFIIECNCFNGSGFYHCDIQQIVAAVTAFMAHSLNAEA